MEYERIQNRREGILELLKTESILTIEEVCRRLKITDSTARRDIKWLEEQKRIRRFHGGISSIDNEYDVFDVRNKTNLESKVKIGSYAAQMVSSGDIIYIGGGSTMFQFAKALIARGDLSNVMVVTATLNVAVLFVEKSDFETVILGGSIKKMDETITSKMTIDNAAAVNYTKMFNGAMGISPLRGITQPSAVLAELEALVASRTDHNVLLVDNSKFGRTGPYTTYGIDQVDKIITNRDTSVDATVKENEIYKGKVIQV